MSVKIYDEYTSLDKCITARLGLIPKNTLCYNGKIVGYRVGHDRFVFDIDVDDGNLVFADFTSFTLSELTSCPSLELRPFGNKLAVSANDNTKESSYREIATMVEGEFGIHNLSKTDVTLKKLYNKYNNLIFDGRLPKVIPVYWNGRLTGSAGICKTCIKYGMYCSEISLSPYYHENRPEHYIDDTLVHEMIHVIYPKCGHQWQFDVMMNEINMKYAPLHITVHSEGKAKINHTYICLDCGNEFGTARRVNCDRYRCKCGGRLVEDFNE